MTKINSQCANIKIVHVSTHDHGGAGIAALRLHQGLIANGVDSSMLVLSKRSSDPGVFSIGPVQPAIERWNQIAASHPGSRPDLEIFTDALSPVDLWKADVIGQADVINLHWVAGILDHSRLSALIREKPVVWTLHDMNAFTGGCHYNWECRRFEDQCGACPQLGSDNPGDIAFTNFSLKRNGYAGATIHVVTPSRWLGAEAGRSALLGRMPRHVIPYGYPLDVFQPGDRLAARSQLGIDPARKVVLFGCDSLSNIRKGFGYLMEAAAILLEDNQPPPLFYFFGHLPQGAGFPGEAISLGRIEDPRILAAVYAMADVFVISSLQDNLPNVVPESLACGTPVVGFDAGGITDMIAHETTGYLVKTGDAAGLAKGIRWVINHVGAAMRANCRLFAQSHYALDIQAKTYTALYRSLLSDRRPARPAPEDRVDARPVYVNLGSGHRFPGLHPETRFAVHGGLQMNADLKRLLELSLDRPLSTGEIMKTNDFYGHATMLKRYAGLPNDYQMKAVIQHGIYMLEPYWNVEIEAPLPVMLIPASDPVFLLRRKTNKALFAIGPCIHYASDGHTESDFENPRQQTGKILTVFLRHGTHDFDVDFDQAHFCRLLNEIGRDFDTIRICIYWKEVQQPRVERYQAEGYQCVTAGHMFDPLFLPRLRDIIKSSSLTLSTFVGTQIGYCIALGIPHALVHIPTKAIARNAVGQRSLGGCTEKTCASLPAEFQAAFGEIRSDITAQQIELVDRYWGLSERKTATQLRQILQIAEDLYGRGENFYIQNQNFIEQQAVDYINAQRNEDALLLLEHSARRHPDGTGLAYARAVCMARLGRWKQAHRCLEAVVNHNPDHAKAHRMLQAIDAACLVQQGRDNGFGDEGRLG